MLCGDGISDLLPPRPGHWSFPVHQIGIVGMGLHLIDNVRLDTLLAACRAGAPVRVPVHRGAAAHSGRHGQPDQPGRAAVTASRPNAGAREPLIDSSVQQALGVVARRAKDLSLHEQLGQRVGYPLEGPYYGTLARLGTSGAVTVSELAGLLNLELSTVSRRVRVLEDRRLVERTRGRTGARPTCG